MCKLSINRAVKLPEGNSSKNEIRVPQESSELRRSHLYTFHLSWTPRACIHWSRMVPPCQSSWWCISVPHAHRHASAHRDAKPRRGDRAPLTSTGLSSSLWLKWPLRGFKDTQLGKFLFRFKPRSFSWHSSTICPCCVRGTVWYSFAVVTDAVLQRITQHLCTYLDHWINMDKLYNEI